MARVGSFGRRRAPSQNLSALIASLLREQQAAQDSAAFDAWQNGGLFQGKAMTDQRLLDYIKGRRDAFSKDDPLWDKWNNSLIQYGFSIGESKIGLAYKQGKASASDVSRFYASQLSKIPKDSEFYRTVAGRAADWAKSAAAAARGAARARADKAARDRYNSLQGTVYSADALENALTIEAQRRGVISGNQRLADANATDLEQFFAQGVTVNGKPVTLSDWRDSAIASYNAIGQQISLAKQNNWATKELTNNRQSAFSKLTNINAIDDRSKYEAARQDYENALQAAGNNPYAIDKVNRDWANTLKSLYDSASQATGTDTNRSDYLGNLVNEMDALNGKESGPTNASYFGNASEKDAAQTAVSAKQNTIDVTSLNNGTAVYGQTDAGGAFKVIADPFGQVANDPSMQKTVVRVDGIPVATYLKGTPIESGFLLSPTGVPIGLNDLTAPINDYLRQGYTQKSTGQTVGFEFTTPGDQSSGTPPKRSWGVYQSDGTMLFTDTNPFATDLIGVGGGYIALGQNQTAGGQISVTGFINPSLESNGQLTGGSFTPLPLGSTVAPDDVNNIFGKSTNPDDVAKAKDYAAYVAAHPQAGPQYSHPAGESANAQFPTYQPPSQTGPSPSYVAYTLGNALTNIGNVMAPLFGGGQAGSFGKQSPDFLPPTPKPGPTPPVAPSLPSALNGLSPVNKSIVGGLQSAAASGSILSSPDTTGAAGALQGSITALLNYADNASKPHQALSSSKLF